MKNSTWCMTVPLALFISCGCAAQTVPQTHVQTLNRIDVTFPRSDSKKPLLLVIGFSRKSNGQTDGWMKRLNQIFLSDRRVDYYQLADFEGVPSVIQSMILHGIRREIHGAEQEHFAIFSKDESAWKEAAGFSVPDKAYVLVADPLGHVLWRTQGPVSDSNLAEARTQVSRLLAGQ